jgi:hypothetical protein
MLQINLCAPGERRSHAETASPSPVQVNRVFTEFYELTALVPQRRDSFSH